MFRIITTILLLIAFGAQTFNRTVIILDYYTNRSAFIKNCENKARPIMQCKGKCQMMKKLKEEEKKDQQYPDRKLVNKNQVVSSESYFANLPINSLHNPIAFQLLLITGSPADRSYAIFHPPSRLV